jgi:hypothetical protein
MSTPISATTFSIVARSTPAIASNRLIRLSKTPTYHRTLSLSKTPTDHGRRCRRHPPITAVVPPGQKMGVFDGSAARCDGLPTAVHWCRTLEYIGTKADPRCGSTWSQAAGR